MISNIAHFGYGYQNHTDIKWYAITQVMIWKIADPSGDYYFTDSLNGNRINIYQEEMDEINKLIDQYYTFPSFSNQTFYMVEKHVLILEDTNHILSQFTVSDAIQKDNNSLIIKDLEEGSHQIILTKGLFPNKPALFYPSSSSQNLVKRGDPSGIKTTLTINVQKTNLKITKIDKDTQSTHPTGEATLKGSTFALYNQNHQKIQELTLEEDFLILEDLDYGKYYLKEIKPGIGYTLNPNTYEITISSEKTENEVTIENEVIKKKLILEKKYGNNTHFESEENISFIITNNKKEQVKKITTNEKGLAEEVLPFGTYTITQLNTTEGYELLEPFTIVVRDTQEEIIQLRDWEIPVPNTYLEINTPVNILFYLLWILFL